MRTHYTKKNLKRFSLETGVMSIAIKKICKKNIFRKQTKTSKTKINI